MVGLGIGIGIGIGPVAHARPGDGVGDACDCDIDGDGVIDSSHVDCLPDLPSGTPPPTAPCDHLETELGLDNCPFTPNADQSDLDGVRVPRGCGGWESEVQGPGAWRAGSAASQAPVRERGAPTRPS